MPPERGPDAIADDDGWWFDAATVACLARHHWPGNVRELMNITHQIMLGARAPEPLGAHRVPAVQRILEPTGAPRPTGAEAPRSAPDASPDRDELTERRALHALKGAQWSVPAAVDALGIAESTLYRFLEQHPLVRKSPAIPDDEIREARAVCAGDRDAMSDRSRISPRSLTHRLNRLEPALTRDRERRHLGQPRAGVERPRRRPSATARRGAGPDAVRPSGPDPRPASTPRMRNTIHLIPHKWVSFIQSWCKAGGAAGAASRCCPQHPDPEVLMRSSMLLLSALALLAFAASPAVAGPPDALGVTYSDCSEFVGVDQMPQDIASALVPAEYVPLPYIIVRVVDCAGISVDGQRARPGRLMQIGVVVANGDPTAFVNNYQVWSATDHGALHGRLTALGVDIDLDHIEYAYAPGKVGGLDLSVSPPHGPAFQVTGVGPFARFPTPFVATWWTEGRRGAVKMRAVYDGVVLGFGAFTLTTDADSDLAAIAGRDVLTFANPADPNVLNTYNVFDFGDMAITVE